MKEKSKIIALFTIGVFAASSLVGAVLVADGFDYDDGPLAGQGDWARGVNNPTSDNPSDHIAVQDGWVRFDWTTTDSINNVVRQIWPTGDAVETGMIYAIFDFRATQAPQSESDVRPGFLSFGDGTGSQQRGFVGLQPGSEPDTLQLGVAPATQLGTGYTYATDLSLNTVYTVMVGFDTENQDTSLWLGTTNPNAVPAITVAGSGSNNGIRRLNLRLYNSDGAGGTTNLGIFEIDNLVVTTIPEPRVYAALAGLLAMGLVLLRRRRR